MKAVHISSLDGPDAVEVVTVADPVVADNEYLVDVRAAGVSFPELLQTRGKYQLAPPLPFIPGSEVAGVVAAAPAGSTIQVGDRVCAFPGTGAYCEQVTVPSDRILPLPDRLSFAEGAALPLNYLTSHFALVVRGRLSPGETVLVHGAAGGVGTASIQVALAFGASEVIAVVSSPEKADIARAAGATSTVLVDGFLAEVKKAHPEGLDVVVDPVGGDRFTDSLRSLKEAGRMLVVGFTAGEIPTVKVNRLLLNNLDVVGVGWGASVFNNPGFVPQQWQALLPHMESGVIAPVVGAQFDVDDVIQALTMLDERRAVGKVVLTFGDQD